MLSFWSDKEQPFASNDKSKAEFRNMNWTISGEVLATASDKVRLWSKDGKMIKERNLGYWLWGLDWSKDERLVVTSEVGQVFILDKDLNILAKKD